MAIPTVPYFLVLLSPGHNEAAAPEHFAAHVAFIDAMAADNVVLLGGDFEAKVDGAEAAYLLHTSSQTEAEQWAARDPLVKNEVCKARVVA